MGISKENIIAAYKAADENGKRMLIALFGEEAVKEVVKLPVTERIKTFADARLALGEEHPLVKEWYCGENLSSDLEAYLQLRVICAALNEGWEPQFTENEYRWFPYFHLYTQEKIENRNDEWKQKRHLMGTGGYETKHGGFACADSSYVPSITTTRFGSRLCLKSEELATYCGKQFINIWADYQLIRK